MTPDVQTLKVDISQEMSYIFLKCKQYDNLSRKYRIIICNRGKPLTMTGKETVIIRMWKDGDSKPYIDRTLDWENGYPVITFTSSMLQYEGTISVDYQIYDPADLSSISTRTSFIEVQKSLINYSGLIAEEDYNRLDWLIQEVLRVPDLIATFETSQGQINSLIAKINADITAYQKSYNKFNADATGLISALRSFLSECQTAENIRISNENTRKSNETKRQTDTATAISNANAATTKANTAAGRADTATSKANTAAEECRVNGLYARSQGDRVDEALQGLDLRLRTVDGGNITDSDPAENIYDGGTL